VGLVGGTGTTQAKRDNLREKSENKKILRKKKVEQRGGKGCGSGGTRATTKGIKGKNQSKNENDA